MSQPLFDGVMIQDTWVLGWHHEPGRLVFDVEASLWPGHPDYEPPRPGEWTCYKPAQLVFDGVQAVEGLLETAVAPRGTDADGSQDFGSLSELKAEPGGYVIAGDFGTVRIKADSIKLEIGDRKK